jgi:hypothetical protein
MSTLSSNLRGAIQSRKLDSVTRALDDVREWLGYQLKPPYTEVVRLRAEEEPQRFAIEFAARLHLHYSSRQTEEEGLVFSVQFSGEAYTDSPSPPIDELFAAGVVDSFEVYGYGARWEGQTVSTPAELLQELEIPSVTLNRLSIQDFLKRIEA